MKLKNEDTIKAQIDTINDMLNVVCDELNECKEINDYEIELNEGVITTCLSEKPERKYRIIVTVKHDLEKEVS